MKLITLDGERFKSKYSAINDAVFILPHTFVIMGIIKDTEWAKSKQPLRERFNLNMSESNIDGRSKEAKNLQYFTWSILKIKTHLTLK